MQRRWSRAQQSAGGSVRSPIAHRHRCTLVLGTVATVFCSTALAFDDAASRLDKMSPMGRRAAAEVARIMAQPAAATAPAATASPAKMESPICFNESRCPRGLRESAPGGQAELSIAVDESGQHIVIGFN